MDATGVKSSAVADSVFLIDDDGSTVEAVSTPYVSEDEIQALLARNVHLLPGAQIDPDNPRRWLLVKREAGIPGHEGGGGWWAVDHLVVDQDAIPTFIEVKRSADIRARREVVAQMLDYAANGSMFLSPGQLREWFERDNPESASEDLANLIGETDADPAEAADMFWQKVGDNLREGRVRLVFVADEIPGSLRRLVEFLNEQMDRVEVLAVEIKRYRTSKGRGALVPRLIGQTARAQSAKERPSRAAVRSVPWTFEEVLGIIADRGDDLAVIGQKVKAWSAQPCIRVTGGTGTRYASVTISVDTGRSAPRGPSVFAVYASADREVPTLEVRANDMCATPPYDRDPYREQLIEDLHSLGIERLDAETVLVGKRPNIPLSQLTNGRLERLLAVVDRWIEDVSAHSARASS